MQTFLANRDIKSGCYNAGFENLKIIEIAEQIKKSIECEIFITKTNDPRSYEQNSDKLINTGFVPEYNIKNAIDEIVDKYQNGELLDNEKFYTVQWMKKLSL